jgi:Antirestriction protein
MKQFTPSDSTKMANAVNKVFGVFAMPLENAFCAMARDFAKDSYDGGCLNFVTNEEGTVGFWYPADHMTYDVTVPSNYYSNCNMQAVAFGAGLTLLVVNMLSWKFYEDGQAKLANDYSTLYQNLREFVFDLSEKEGDFMDGRAVAGFID